MRKVLGVLLGVTLIGAMMFFSGCVEAVYSDQPVLVCAVPAPQFVTVQNNTAGVVLVEGVVLYPGQFTVVNVAPTVAVCGVTSFESDINDFVIGLEPLNVTVVGDVVFIL